MANSNKPVFDVSKPSKNAPTPTSRPVIVTHTPMIKDPMVSDKSETEPEKAVEETKSGATAGEKVIAPISKPEEQRKNPDSAAAKEQDGQPAPASEEEKKVDDAAVVEAVVEQASKAKMAAPTKEDLARQAEIEKMIEEKKYFVPVGQVTHRRHVRHFVAGMIVLLVVILAGGYLAADAGLVDLGVKLPYDLIP